MANGYYGFAGGGPYGTINGTAYVQPTIQTAAVPGVAAIGHPQSAFLQPLQTVYTATAPQVQTYDPYAPSPSALSSTQYISAMGAQVLQQVAAAPQGIAAASPYEQYFAPLTGVTPAMQPLVYTVPQAVDNASYQVAKIQSVYDPTKRYFQPAAPSSFYPVNSDAAYSTLTMAAKPVYMAAAYGAQVSQRQNIAIKAYNVQPVALAPTLTPAALAPSMLAAGTPFAPAVRDNQPSVLRSQKLVAMHPTSAISSGLEVQPNISNLSSYYSSKHILAASNSMTPVVSSMSTSVAKVVGTNVAFTPSVSSTANISTNLGVTVSLANASFVTGSHSISEKIGHSFQGKLPARSLQLQYCDVCKISCAGPQAYREHLEGQRHKKKEAVVKPSTSNSTSRAPINCEACDVTCTSADLYAVHLRSAKHQRALKLHVKPVSTEVPSCVVGNSVTATAISSSNVNHSISSQKSAPAIRLILNNSTQKMSSDGNLDDSDQRSSPDVQPVGLEFVQDLFNENGIISSFFCKLCECKFTDPFAKIMHTKGRRHRFMYKKKVDPNLKIDWKLTGSENKTAVFQPTSSMRLHFEDKWKLECEQRRFEEGCSSALVATEGTPSVKGPVRRPESFNDRHIMAKHNAIYPTEAQLEMIQSLVVACEKSLKLVSEQLSEMSADGINTTSIKGVMRVGLVSKGLLLRGDDTVHLVVLCAEKPTRTLLTRVVDALPKQLSIVSSTKYVVELCVEEAGFIVAHEEEPLAHCVIMMTSPIIREQLLSPESVAAVADPPDVLDRQKCLEALALLRHAKWFQARASGLPSCVVIIRVLRDFCRRQRTWQPLPEWALELLVEKCISSAGQSLSPGEGFRRIFECVSAGILLPGGAGLFDPCEKEVADAAVCMTKQEREDFTTTAQDVLRQLAFCKIFRVLDMPKLARNASVKRLYTDSFFNSEDEKGKRIKPDDN